MDIEEAIERLKYINMAYDCNNYYSRYDLDCIETALNLIQTQQAELEKKDTEIIEAKEANRQLSLELEKKEAIINLMAKQLVEAHGWFYSEFDNFTEKDWIDYFTKKVEKEGK